MATETLSKLGTGGSIFWSILLIILGAVAIGVPLVTASGVVIFLAWLILLAGAVLLIQAFLSNGVGGMIWKVLAAVVYLAAGAFLLTHPVMALAALTLMLAIFFVAAGIAELATWFQNRGARAAGWLLFSGLVSLVLGAMIWMQWPSSALWAIGTLVGVNMIMTGVSRLMVNLAARGVRRALA